MTAVLISIKPRWCEMIARGAKVIEVRKTRPKINTPFKCYVYCYGKVDNADFHDQYLCNISGSDWNRGNHFCSYGERKDGDGNG